MTIRYRLFAWLLLSTSASSLHAHSGFPFHQQDPESGNFVIEAEAFHHAYTGELWEKWAVVSRRGASGGEVIKADPFWKRATRDVEVLKHAPRVGYDIEFLQGGIYRLMMKGEGFSAAANTVFYKLIPYGDAIFDEKFSGVSVIHLSKPGEHRDRSYDEHGVRVEGGRYTLWVFRVERKVEIDDIYIGPVGELDRYGMCQENGYLLAGGSYPWKHQARHVYNKCGEANTPPVLAEVGTRVLAVGGYLEIPLSAWDIEDHALDFSADELPGFVELITLGGDQAVLKVAPRLGDEGSYQLTVDVTDGTGEPAGLTDRETITLIVHDGPPPCDC